MYFYNLDESVYEGEWKGDKRHGNGKWKHPSGIEYEGKVYILMGDQLRSSHPTCRKDAT